MRKLYSKVCTPTPVHSSETDRQFGRLQPYWLTLFKKLRKQKTNNEVKSLDCVHAPVCKSERNRTKSELYGINRPH